jgi:hypothetical protein
MTITHTPVDGSKTAKKLASSDQSTHHW